MLNASIWKLMTANCMCVFFFAYISSVYREYHHQNHCIRSISANANKRRPTMGGSSWVICSCVWCFIISISFLIDFCEAYARAMRERISLCFDFRIVKIKKRKTITIKNKTMPIQSSTECYVIVCCVCRKSDMIFRIHTLRFGCFCAVITFLLILYFRVFDLKRNQMREWNAKKETTTNKNNDNNNKSVRSIQKIKWKKKLSDNYSKLWQRH